MGSSSMSDDQPNLPARSTRHTRHASGVAGPQRGQCMHKRVSALCVLAETQKGRGCFHGSTAINKKTGLPRTTAPLAQQTLHHRHHATLACPSTVRRPRPKPVQRQLDACRSQEPSVSVCATACHDVKQLLFQHPRRCCSGEAPTACCPPCPALCRLHVHRH